jgi:hypothetical protein
MTRSRKSLRGGNANTLPMEYFGGNSGNYHVDSNVNQSGSGAYGDFVAQSFGEPFNDNGTGPNMFVHPNSSGSLTGGGRKGRKGSGRKGSGRKGSGRKGSGRKGSGRKGSGRKGSRKSVQRRSSSNRR